jgi:membrane-bound metal-dependent hydrolase YbcI (DUF457 family)
MKGIAHFMTGIALATCVPDVVALARNGSLLPVLGGVGGLLPDLLDFRFVRYFERYDVEIDPGPVLGSATAHDAAESVADALVREMRAAFKTGRPHRVILHTVQVGHDLWRRYTVSFIAASEANGACAVRVQIGPLVGTGGASLPGSDLGGEPAERSLGHDLVTPYSQDFVIDSFTGPSFTFAREGDRLEVAFLDWHHRWTHSLVLAAGVGAVAGTIGTLVAGLSIGLLSAGLIWGGFTAHILEDQLGHLGCNLLWPITRRRRRGLGLLHAGEGIPNFLVVWTALALILYNLDRLGGPGHLLAAPYLALAVGLPWLVLGGTYLSRRRAAEIKAPLVDQSAEMTERLAEIQSGIDD